MPVYFYGDPCCLSFQKRERLSKRGLYCGTGSEKCADHIGFPVGVPPSRRVPLAPLRGAVISEWRAVPIFLISVNGERVGDMDAPVRDCGARGKVSTPYPTLYSYSFLRSQSGFRRYGGHFQAQRYIRLPFVL